jgi:hypothetical protein
MMNCTISELKNSLNRYRRLNMAEKKLRKSEDGYMVYLIWETEDKYI